MMSPVLKSYPFAPDYPAEDGLPALGDLSTLDGFLIAFPALSDLGTINRIFTALEGFADGSNIGCS